MLTVKGNYRVQSIYNGKDRAYVTLKDRADASVTKFAFPLPLNKAVVDDALLSLDGTVKSQLFGNNVSLNFEGNISAVAEK